MGIALLWIWGVLAVCWIVLYVCGHTALDRAGMGLAISLLGMAAALAMIRRARRGEQRQ